MKHPVDNALNALFESPALADFVQKHGGDFALHKKALHDALSADLKSAHNALSSLDPLYKVELALARHDLKSRLEVSFRHWLTGLDTTTRGHVITNGLEESLKGLSGSLTSEHRVLAHPINGANHELKLFLELFITVCIHPSVEDAHELECDDGVLEHIVALVKVIQDYMSIVLNKHFATAYAFLAACEEEFVAAKLLSTGEQKEKALVLIYESLEREACSLLEEAVVPELYKRNGLKTVNFIQEIKKLGKECEQEWLKAVRELHKNYNLDNARCLITELRVILKNDPSIKDHSVIDSLLKDPGETSIRTSVNIYMLRYSHYMELKSRSGPGTSGLQFLLEHCKRLEETIAVTIEEKIGDKGVHGKVLAQVERQLELWRGNIGLSITSRITEPALR